MSNDHHKFPYGKTELVTIDGNTAASYVAYLNSEVIAIYPITPSSVMGELADEMAGKGETNKDGFVPRVVELQSEGGAAGAIHGALTAGAQASTFTASQGLLLMIPNMYKIAGELTPTVFHVSARAISCQALSIFGDHGDIMAVRQTGFGLVASADPQEVMDLASISIRTSLKSRIPIVHFFDGFRTSHEIQKIYELPKEFYKEFLDEEDIFACRLRALDPKKATLRGTAQNPDIYFQGRETVNKYYIEAPKIFEDSCELFYKLTGRRYHAYQYVGASDAEDIIIIMGSGANAVDETVDVMIKKFNAKCGVLKVRLFRPFSGPMLLNAIPDTVKRIAVLDRSKEPGAIGEPLYMDVQTAFAEALNGVTGYKKVDKLPLIIGGRYGLGSKEFTPAMIKGVFEHLQSMSKPGTKIWSGFTVGIKDDVTHTSIDYSEFDTEDPNSFRGKFFGLGSDGTIGANKNSIKIIGSCTDKYAQGYFVYDSKKAGAVTISHLRFSDKPIKSTYLIQKPNFVAIHNPSFLGRYDLLEGIEEGSTVLLNTLTPPDKVFKCLPEDMQKTIIDKKLKFYVIDATTISEEVGLRGRINIPMQAAFFKISKVLPEEVFIKEMENAIKKTYGAKGKDVVEPNIRAIHLALERIYEVKIPEKVEESTCTLYKVNYDKNSEDAKFIEQVILPVMANKGDKIPVSALPENGAIPVGTSKIEKRNIAIRLPDWNPEICTQCNFCSFICPHATIVPKLIEEDVLKSKVYLKEDEFPVVKAKGYKSEVPLYYHLQVYPDDCTGCGACAEFCPGVEKDPNTKEIKRKALTMRPKDLIQAKLRKSEKQFLALPETDEKYIDPKKVKDVGFKKSYFEFSGACAGCGETPYVRLITQLYGDKMYVANATGCSSIYGGTMPISPYTKNERGEGVAWQSSLFEDNAEFGYGIGLAAKKLKEIAYTTLDKVITKLSTNTKYNELIQIALKVKELKSGEERKFKEAVYDFENLLKKYIANENVAEIKRELSELASVTSHLLDKVVWILGGDGWAYDIGYGGLDHVVASGENVNILVLDTGVYSNTGGQNSKATPMAAVAKFATAGKPVPKKELGLMAMAYKTAYVAQIAYGANLNQTLKAIHEAVEFPGTSLVIAYSPCIEHGIPMEKAAEHCKKAVACGLWPLFRFDPRRMDQGLNPLQLDSKELTLSFKEFANQETRFRKLKNEFPEIAEQLIAEAEIAVKRNYAYFQKLASLSFEEFKIEIEKS